MRLHSSLVLISDAQHRPSSPSSTNFAVVRPINHPKDNIVYTSVFLVPSAYLDELYIKLNCEDSHTRPLRRALGFMDILNKVNNF